MRTIYSPLLCAGMLTLLSAPVLTAQVATVPDRTDDNIIVAAYNIQFFGQSSHDYPKLAQVIQHFDVCGVIEIKQETHLPLLVKELEALTGKDWGYVFGVRTHRPSGTYHEAYGAVWRRDRVELGDGVTGGIWDLEEAYRNDPYIVAFKRKGFDFVLGLLHTRWTDDDEGTRENEVAMIADHIHWMKGFIKERDLILAGDFNYPGTAAPMRQLVEETNLVQLDRDPKSTFKTDGSGFASSYDHIFTGEEQTRNNEYVADSCHTLDVATLIYGNQEPINMRKARRDLSDHLPIFAVFRVPPEDQDDD